MANITIQTAQASSENIHLFHTATVTKSD